MRQPFFSVVNAVIYLLLALYFAAMAVNNNDAAAASLGMNVQVVWGMTGLMFIMAYFSLVHLKDK